MKSTTRRYDIDWLRVIAIGLLIVYHAAIGFQPWGVFIGFIQNNNHLDKIWIPMSMLNVWRIPLLFYISGMGVYFALRKRNVKQLILERTKRILIPFVFGVVCIVPLHYFLWQSYYKQAIAYRLEPGHLWFLANIFIYALVFSPVFLYLSKKENKTINWLKRLLVNPIGLILICIPFVLETLIVRPGSYEFYAYNWHGFWLGMLCFIFGFLLVSGGSQVRTVLLRWRWLYLLLAAGLFAVRVWVFNYKSPSYLLPVETNLWIFSILGFADKYLNRPSKTLSYLSRGAYPIYIVHMVFLYLVSYYLFPLNLNPILELFLSIGTTTLLCFLFYEFVILKVKFIQPVFGVSNTRY